MEFPLGKGKHKANEESIQGSHSCRCSKVEDIRIPPRTPTLTQSYTEIEYETSHR